MAKKSRTPPPPRRVQAPKQRHTPREPRANQRLLVAGGAVLVLVAAAVAGAVFLVGGGTSAEETLRAAGCTIEKHPAQGRQHVEQVKRTFKYNSDPPTTGPHNPVPAPFDVYDEPVEQSRLIHNLEHGAMVVQYGTDVPQSTVDQIVAWYRDDPNGIVVAPLPRLGDRIVLEAWVTPEARPGEEPRPGQGVLAKCGTFDEGAFDAFKDDFGFRGPERFPRDQLQPGQ